MDLDVNLLQIPFLKFQIDPAIIDNLELIKYELINPPEPEELFLLQHKSGEDYTYICVYEHQNHNRDEENARNIMQGFLSSKKEFLDFKGLEFIKPKYEDYYFEHYIAVIKE